MYYRFECGVFVRADNFEEAKKKFIERIEKETEVKSQWNKCTCLGLEHRFDCPEMRNVIPY